MANQETLTQQRKVAKVMHEFKQGKLKGGKGNHPKVKSRKQAIAIALSEAGASSQQTSRKKPATKSKRAPTRAKAVRKTPVRTRRATGNASNRAGA